jgi:nucleoside 2-deoxyribosyltransferase
MQMSFFAPRRIGICGSSAGLQPEAALFCQAIGEHLGSKRNVIIVNRGIKRRSSSGRSTNLAADFHFVEGAKRKISGQDQGQRIETYINDDDDSKELFREGRILVARGQSSEARRFYMISKVDALIAIAGSRGTHQQLVLANALDLPIMPVPIFHGAARDFWRSHRNELCLRLKLTCPDADRIERSAGSGSLAVELIERLIAALERRCFVIMPFDEDLRTLYERAIEPAVRALGDRPIKLDQEKLPGNISQQIDEGIATCDYALVVLDRAKPNVFYELGLAHAQRKPVIILRNEKEVLQIPFDISMHQRINYVDVNPTLVVQIQETIASLSRLDLRAG